MVPGALALALFTSHPVYAATDAELAEIREQIRQIKESYEARIQALEQKLKEAEAKFAAPAPASSSTSAVPGATAPSGAASPPVPPVASAPGPAPSGSAFNPAISAILQGRYSNLSQDPKQYAIAGFVPSGGEIAPPKRGFSLAESELQLSANV